MSSKATEKMGWGERIDALWGAEGVESSKRGYWTAWVRRFGKFIAPKKLYEATQQEVEAFYQRLATEGRARWQVEQADGALRLVYQKMYPVDWARAWQPTWPEVAMTERPLNRERVADDPAWAGRSDVGDLPPRFESFLDELRRRMRERQLSYRTEQTYSNWVRRFLVFARPESRDTLEVDAVRSYLGYLAVKRGIAAATQPSGAR